MASATRSSRGGDSDGERSPRPDRGSQHGRRGQHLWRGRPRTAHRQPGTDPAASPRTRRTPGGISINRPPTGRRGRSAVRGLMQEGRWVEARVLLEESVAELDAATRRNPADHHAFSLLCRRLFRFAAVAEQQGRTRRASSIFVAGCGWRNSGGASCPVLMRSSPSRKPARPSPFRLARRGDLDESRSLPCQPPDDRPGFQNLAVAGSSPGPSVSNATSYA